jgi:hypothetical protein
MNNADGYIFCDCDPVQRVNLFHGEVTVCPKCGCKYILLGALAIKHSDYDGIWNKSSEDRHKVAIKYHQFDRELYA